VSVSGVGSLLNALREELGVVSVKDGCSPQGQCGCCTVWIDGRARVACVTPVRRVSGRSVTTLEGLPEDRRERLVSNFVAAGASQCGFCTPGIVMRLSALADGDEPVLESAVESALLAHVCRCTGWQSIVEASVRAPDPQASLPQGSLADGARTRAAIEGGRPQRSDAATVEGRGGFADDAAPRDALVAVPGGASAPGRGQHYVVGESLLDARGRSGKIQGRRTTAALSYPLEVAPGPWDLTLRTTWVEPGYLETDASWCAPGQSPATVLANGGAFGAKEMSPVPAAARELADRHQRTMRVLWSREDVVRWGPKRPPIALGLRSDGSGVLRVARTENSADLDAWFDAVKSVARGVVVEFHDVAGPPVSGALRASGWAELCAAWAVLDARAAGATGAGTPVEVCSPDGGRARVCVRPDDSVSVEVWAGETLDATTLRSYCLGAVHQALGWVWHEGLVVDADGVVQDLTMRSFGIMSARDTPRIEVTIHDSNDRSVNGSDAVFAAAAAAAWSADGFSAQWPTRRARGR
jgi:xanthine dehydrogenase small subunit